MCTHFHFAEIPVVAVLPHPRLGYDTPPPAKISLPANTQGRGQLWSDAVFEAVLTLKNQLGSRNEAVAAAAANSILELERTRMRHDKTVAGSSLTPDQFGAAGPDDSDQFDTMTELPELASLHREPPAPQASDALAGHTAEALSAIPMIGSKPTTRDYAERIVRRFLNEQVLEAEDIAPGQFMVHFRRELRKTAASALPN